MAFVCIELPAIEHMFLRLGSSPPSVASLEDDLVAKLQHGTPKDIEGLTGKHCAERTSRPTIQRECLELKSRLQEATKVGMT